MSTVRLPLVGVNNQRGIDATSVVLLGKDQRFVNCTFDLVKNPITGKATVYVEKRPGWGVQSTPAAGSVSTGAIRTDQLGTIVSAFGATNSTIYDGATSVYA